MKLNKLNHIKKVIDFNLFFPLFIVLSFVGLITSLQTYFIYHKTVNPFLYLLLTRIIYNWYFIIFALIILLLVINKKEKLTTKIIIDIFIIAAAIIFHQLMQYLIEKLFLVKSSYNSFTQIMFYNPLLWLDIVMVILFYLGFYLIEYKKQSRENELKSYQLKEKLSLSKLHELKSKINPAFLNESLERISELIKQGKVNDANDLLTSLSEFLRISLYQEENYSTLKEELYNLEKYLSLERIISQRNIELKTQINSTLFGIQILSFSLLYLIKNILSIIKDDIDLEIHSVNNDDELEVIINFRFNEKEEVIKKFEEIEKFAFENGKINLIKNSDNNFSIAAKFSLHKENQLLETF